MRIRPFRESDAHDVASLWQYWFRDKTLNPDPELSALVKRVYIEDPNVDDEVTPLVAEDPSGRLQGFLGVTVMPVEVDDRAGKMAGVFPSVVAPGAPTAVASLLLRRFLAGPQCLSFSDGGHVKFERIWETLGGRIAQMQSLRWVKLLRPMRLGAEIAIQRRALGSVAPILRTLSNGADVAGRGFLRKYTGLGTSDSRGSEAEKYSSEPILPSKFVEISSMLHAGRRLRPLYSVPHVAWQFTEMGRIREQGEFTANVVLDSSGRAVGYYVYFLNPGHFSRVFAVEAADRHLTAVIDELLLDAYERGAGAVIGRLEPRLRRPLAVRGALLHNGGSLQMIHARDSSLMDDALLGRLAFNRLQGENWFWWAIDQGRAI